LLNLVGKSIKVTPLPGLYENTFYDGMLGTIVSYDEIGSLFSVLAEGRLILLIRREFEIL